MGKPNEMDALELIGRQAGPTTGQWIVSFLDKTLFPNSARSEKSRMDSTLAPNQTSEQLHGEMQPAAAPAEVSVQPTPIDWVNLFTSDPYGMQAFTKMLMKGEAVEQAFYGCFKAVTDKSGTISL